MTGNVVQFRQVNWLLSVSAYVLLSLSSFPRTVIADDIYLFITVDTETDAGCYGDRCRPDPIEHRILGLNDGQYYGIGLIMDMLEKRGMRATFFVNAFLDAYYREDEIVASLRPIIERGHDFQFHAHVDFRCFRWCGEGDLSCREECTRKRSFLQGNTYENQLAILREGAKNIARWSGKYPVAFRGGAFKVDVTTLRALHTLGIRVDSSLSGPSNSLTRIYQVNKVMDIGGMVEIPLTNFASFSFGPFRKYRMLDFESNTLEETLRVIEEAKHLKLRTVMLLLHSFTFCRDLAACPNTAMIDRFDRLLTTIANDPTIHVITVSEFAERFPEEPMLFIGSGALPETGYFLTLWRSYVRFNDGWQNVIFLIVNIVFVFLLISLLWFATRRRTRRR